MEIFSLIVIPLSSFSLTFEFRKPLSTTEKESKIFVVINFHPCLQLSVSSIFVVFSGSNGLKMDFDFEIFDFLVLWRAWLQVQLEWLMVERDFCNSSQ